MKALIPVVGTIAVTAVAVLLKALFVMLMWNWFMPQTFNVPELTFTTAMGLSVLASILTAQSSFTYKSEN